MNFNWGIVGTGSIAHEMGQALVTKKGQVYAVAGTSLTKATLFGETYGAQYCYDSIDELVANQGVDILYIATPHNSHYDIMKKGLANGKHIFCEKAITLNSTELEECVALAKEKKLVICDGVTLFHMPLYKRLKELTSTLGELKMIQVNFGSDKEYDPTNRFFSPDLAGGALLDIGVYAISFARYFMSSVPTEILSTVNLSDSGVDETSGIILKNKESETAVISLTFRAKQPKRGMVAFEKGYLEILDFPRADQGVITYSADGHTQVITEGRSDQAMLYEIADMEDYIQNQTGEENLRMIRDVMTVMTTLRKEWGIA